MFIFLGYVLEAYSKNLSIVEVNSFSIHKFIFTSNS